MPYDAEDDDFVFLMWQWLLLQSQEKERRIWVHPLNVKRTEEKTLMTFIGELRADEKKFHNFTRMSSASFDYVLQLIGDRIRKSDTNWRRSISPEERLFITLRFLGTGESFKSFHYYFRVGATTIGKIVMETCEAIWNILFPLYMVKPTTEKWIKVANRFQQLWNFPNCIGAIDSKHIRIECPTSAGSTYYNYKNFHSVVLQAVVDADANFVAIDVGDSGRNGDSGVFTSSHFGKLFYSCNLNIPQPRRMCYENDENFPFVLVGDEAYPLTKNLMRPFPQRQLTSRKRIYNYRLSRARRIVECAFGMLTKRFRMFETAFSLHPEKVKLVTLAACVLHNMIREREGNIAEIHEELLRVEECSDEATGNNNSLRPSNAAFAIRNQFADYFNSKEGSIPWQNKFAFVVE